MWQMQCKPRNNLIVVRADKKKDRHQRKTEKMQEKSEWETYLTNRIESRKESVEKFKKRFSKDGVFNIDYLPKRKFKRLKPDLIVVRAEKEKDKAQRETETGIVIPDGAWDGEISEGVFEGIVLRIGGKVREVDVGDKILYTIFSIKQKLNDNEFLMREQDVLGVVE